MSSSEKIECIVCSKELENWAYKDTEVHPMNGLHFRTYGHYGSTIFDPVLSSKYLDIAICDVCVMKNINKVRGSGLSELDNNVSIITDACERHG